MGKPIAGRGQYPFAINGIIVDGAKINGKTYVKDLYLYKQRSYNYYDLIDDDGTIFEFVEITHRREDTTKLKYLDNSEFSVQFIKDNSFFIKTQDIDRNIYGFVVLLQENKIKVSTGDYIFYHQGDDYNLLSVRANPSTINVAVGDMFDVNILFDPYDYSHTAGTWVIDHMVEEMTKARSPNSQFKCLQPGHSTISFIPDANSKLTTTTQVFIEDAVAPPITLNSFIAMKNDPNDRSGYNGLYVFSDDEFVVTLIFTPFDYVPSHAFDVMVDSTVFEYIGTDDFINYKFKAQPDADAFRGSDIIFIKDNLSAKANIQVRPQVPDGDVMLKGPQQGRVGTPMQFRVSEFNGIGDKKVTWISLNEDVGTIDQNGVLTPLKPGSVRVKCILEGYTDNAYGSTVTIYENIPDIVLFTNIDQYVYIPGDVIQIEHEYSPSGIKDVGYWNAKNDTYFSLTKEGLLTILDSDPSGLVYRTITYNTLGTGTYNPVTLTSNGSSVDFAIAASHGQLDLKGLNSFGMDMYRYAPVGGLVISSISFNPLQATNASRKLTIIVDDETILRAELVPSDTNIYRFPAIHVHGLKRGITNIRIIPEANPSLAQVIKFTVY